MSDDPSSTTDPVGTTPDAGASDAENYRDALLSIQTPISVTLAERKETLRNILALVPGSMLTFDTHCDRPLELTVGGHVIASGETVKIGDKFGLRIRAIGESLES